MDPIYPWLDPVEVRRLADRLMRPERQATVAPVDAGFDDGFVGFTGTQPFSTPAQQPPVTPPPLPPRAFEEARVFQPAAPDPQPSPVSEPAFQPAPEPTFQATPEPAFQAAPEPAFQAAPEPVAPPAPEPEPAPAIIHTPPSEESQVIARGPFLDRITRFRDWMRHNFSATGIFILDRDGAVIFDESSHGRLHFLARSLALASRKPGSSGGNVHVKIGAGATLEVIPVETTYGLLVLGAVVPDALPTQSVAAVTEALTQVASPPA
ncbi:MAG: hypothetical protein EOP88_20345 [Verrucomicrobiaceae bacterium]|nr:MAG: hypothetical protein EOP88_20345 [Verrucomicrobiaceae bacterium]